MMVSDSSHKERSTSKEFEGRNDNSHVGGDLVMVRRLIGSQMRKNNFHSRCHVLGNLCSIIIDGGSCVNLASETLVSKLSLPTIVHPRLYRLNWPLPWEGMKIRCCVTWCQWRPYSYCWVGHGSMIRREKRRKEKEVEIREIETTKEKKIHRREVRKVFLAKREPLYALPTNMLLHSSFSSMISLPTSMKDLLKKSKGMFQEDIPIGATLPNRATYRTNPKEGKRYESKSES
ncbi:hypothetical protein CR513_00344, partial [Mucuna pruriens]